MKKIQIGLIGFGTVGTGVLKIMGSNSKMIRERLGASIVVKKVADLDIRSDREIKVNKNLLTTNVEEILNDPSIVPVR